MIYDHYSNPLVIAKHEAERRARLNFQDNYGSFWKCSACGARLFDACGPRCFTCGPSDTYRAGYAPPPRHRTRP